MFGATFVLNARARFLWGLRHGLRLAADGPPPLASLASRLSTTVASETIDALSRHPFHEMWVGVLANQMRHGGPRPDAAVAAGLLGVAHALLITPPEGVDTLATFPDGTTMRPGDARTILSVGSDGRTRPLVEEGPSGLLLLGDNPLLRHLIGDAPGAVAAATGDWAMPFAEGMSLLATVSPEQHRRFIAHVTVIASLAARPGMLQSLSIGEWPGCVLARCDNAPAHVADQLVHEASHQILDAELARRPDLLDAMERSPAAYSPFFQQPRPCTKLLHGLVSYLEVLRFWEAILEHDQWDAPLTGDIARRRYEHVAGMCADGVRSLRAATDHSLWKVLCDLLDALAPAFNQLSAEVSTEVSLTAVKRADLCESLVSLSLPPIETSEVVLGVDGAKVSRLSVSLEQGAALARALGPDCVPLFSRSVMLTRSERLKGGFHNLIHGTFEYYRPPAGAIVHAYVGSHPDELRRAVLADENDQAGEYLGIPHCCRAFFEQNWERARAEFDGDLAELLLGNDNAVVVGRAEVHPWQTNVFAMYFGYGATWHFPCSLECAATCGIIEARAARLDRLLPEVSRIFRDWQRRPVLWSPVHGLIVAHRQVTPDRIDFEAADALEWTAGLRRLQVAGTLQWRRGTWRIPDGQSLSEVLDGRARVLLWR